MKKIMILLTPIFVLAIGYFVFINLETSERKTKTAFSDPPKLKAKKSLTKRNEEKQDEFNSHKSTIGKHHEYQRRELNLKNNKYCDSLRGNKKIAEDESLTLSKFKSRFRECFKYFEKIDSLESWRDQSLQVCEAKKIRSFLKILNPLLKERKDSYKKIGKSCFKKFSENYIAFLTFTYKHQEEIESLSKKLGSIIKWRLRNVLKEVSRVKKEEEFDPMFKILDFGFSFFLDEVDAVAGYAINEFILKQIDQGKLYNPDMSLDELVKDTEKYKELEDEYLKMMLQR